MFGWLCLIPTDEGVAGSPNHTGEGSRHLAGRKPNPFLPPAVDTPLFAMPPLPRLCRSQAHCCRTHLLLATVSLEHSFGSSTDLVGA